MGNVRLTVRIDFGADRALGPGKIRLLEAIGKTGSISRAGRALGMSYRRAWLLIDDMNRCFPRAGGGDATRRRAGRRRGTHAVRRGADRKLSGDRSAGDGSREPHLQALQNSLRRKRVRSQKPLKTSIRAATAR